MSFFNDVGKFFNDVGTWVNDNVIQPIGNIWNNGIDNIKTGNSIDKRINKKIKESEGMQNIIKGIEKTTKPMRDKITEGMTNNWPLTTEEDKQNMREALKPEMLRGEEPTGNNQETGEGESTKTTETPSIRELWEREDAIREETQEREDTAYQRAIEDMRKAGINPNLVGVNPASSGGGIISATGQGLITTEMTGIINEAIAEINNTVKADENQKDRIQDIISSLIQAIVMYKTFGRKK